MRSMFVSLVLLLLASPAHAQFAADSPYCRSNPDAHGCPPPVRIQIVPPRSSLADDLIRMWNDSETERQRRREANAQFNLEARRLRLDEAREERLRQGAPTPQGATPPAPLAPAVQTQLLAFAAAYPDWDQHILKMMEYGAKLRPGETDATEYLTLLYRLTKMDAWRDEVSQLAALRAALTKASLNNNLHVYGNAGEPMV